VNPQIWWLVSRSSGIIAWALVSLSVCWGLFISTKAVAKASSPAWLLDFHRYLGGLCIVFTAVHMVGLAADNYVTFGWAELFVPMASGWKPGAVAFGIVGFYLLVAIEATSLAMRRLPRRLWRWIHRSSFPLYVVATYHGIRAGTDHENQWFRLAALASINVVLFLTLVLILAARRAAINPRRQTPELADATREMADAASG
jgi:predicted ferric reductase